MAAGRRHAEKIPLSLSKQSHQIQIRNTIRSGTIIYTAISFAWLALPYCGSLNYGRISNQPLRYVSPSLEYARGRMRVSTGNWATVIESWNKKFNEEIPSPSSLYLESDDCSFTHFVTNIYMYVCMYVCMHIDIGKGIVQVCVDIHAKIPRRANKTRDLALGMGG